MWKRLLLVLALLLTVARADALEYTDVYYNPDESGWGMFLVQSDTFQFVALFIYGPDNKPTWYTATLTQDADGNYSGQLFATTGTYFGLAWNPAQLTIDAVGTVLFEPTDAYHATVTYTIAGVPPVKKTVTRQTLKPYVLSGKYSGSISGTVSACTVPSDNNPKFRARYNLTVTQAGDDTSAKLIFTFVDTNDGIICTATGPLSHFGRLYKMSNAKYTCLGPGFPAGNQTIVTIDSLHPTEQGIEGALSGPTPDGCVVDYSFSAVLNN